MLKPWSCGLLALVAFASHCAADSGEGVPQITSATVLFVGGEILRYSTNKVLYTDPEEALKKHSPVSFSETPILVKSWKRMIMIRSEKLYEGSATEVTVYDYRGKQLTRKRVIGDAFILEKARRIFLGQRSWHARVDKSFLLDQDGRSVREIPQPQNVIDFGVANDEKIIWISSSHIVNGIPVGQVNIISSDGDEIASFEFSEGKTIELEYKGTKYKINIATPELPG